MTDILLQSFLFAPANRPAFTEKVGRYGADAIILDLEDAVPPAEKEAARRGAVEAIYRWSGQAIYVRINPLDARTLYAVAVGLADLAAVVVPGLTGIVAPKIESVGDVRALDAALAEAEGRRGLDPLRVEIMPLLETAKGIWNCWDVMRASPRIRRVAFGAIDFARDIGATPDPDGHEVLFARSRIVVASRAAQLERPIDTVCPALDDVAAVERDARMARRLGFGGKMAIHPKQLAAIHAAFSPTLEEIAGAERIVAAFSQAESRGEGSVDVDRELVDYPVYETARQTLALAEAVRRRKTPPGA